MHAALKSGLTANVWRHRDRVLAPTITEPHPTPFWLICVFCILLRTSGTVHHSMDTSPRRFRRAPNHQHNSTPSSHTQIAPRNPSCPLHPHPPGCPPAVSERAQQGIHPSTSADSGWGAAALAVSPCPVDASQKQTP